MLVKLLTLATAALCSTAAVAAPSDPSDSVSPPIFDFDFPDPAVIQLSNGTYFAFSSRSTVQQGGQTVTINTQRARSESFQSGWELIPGDSLPNPGPWTDSTNPQVLTPDIDLLSDGSFILYYIAVSATQTGEHCIGAATSPNVTGPFTPLAHPLSCPPGGSAYGTADPNGFRAANGDYYLVFKNASGHNPDHTTNIVLQQLGQDGHTPLTGWSDLLNSTAADEDDVECPTLVANPRGGYVLFYTAGTFNNTNLRIEYATSPVLNGTYTRRGVLVQSQLYNGTNISAPVGFDIVPTNPTQAMFEGYDVDNIRERYTHTLLLSYNSETNVTIAA